MMGFSYSNFDGPEMCFNPAKNWQFGWFEPTGEAISYSEAAGSLTYPLVGVGRTSPEAGKYVVVQVPNGGTDYYVGYNRKSGSNAGVVEHPNEVTIVSRDAGTGYGESLKVAHLVPGGQYVISDYKGLGYDLTITFTARQPAGSDSIGQASVDFTWGGVPTPAPTPLQCPDGQSKFELTIVTDNYPQETSYSLKLGNTEIDSAPTGSFIEENSSVSDSLSRRRSL
mmetsp:Transcript_8579/g.21472  ORF Transcript_8579/g.21472 Transcript_8579/m.21472 type:complete len:225 (+) Transcript_8579:1790-2464(+)